MGIRGIEQSKKAGTLAGRGSGFLLSQRDEKLIIFLYEQQFLTTKVLLDDLFPGVDRRNIYGRLRVLERQRLIIRKRHMLSELGTVIRLSEIGLDLARTLSVRPMIVFVQPSIEGLLHDSIVSQVRIYLERNIGGKWLAEHSLGDANLPHRPDGLFLPGSSKTIVAIEVENSTKNRDPFFAKARSWNACKEVEYVLYVTTRPQIHRILRSRLLEIADNKRICIRSMEELKAAQSLEQLLETGVYDA